MRDDSPSPRPASPRGRWAPSPTGWLHVGNARTALVAWLSVRAAGGRFVWRLEDLDPPRVLAGAAEAGEVDLAWLGLDWDEGPGRGGPHAPYVQSRRHELYEGALERLAAAGRLFPCRRSRKDLRELASAPHGPSGTPPYPKHLRPRELPEGWFERARLEPAGNGRPGPALRFLVDDEPVSFTDRVYGLRSERVGETVGDFVLKRRDGLYAYQLAVVVDDAAMGIDEVVRGADLIDSTGRQIQLLSALGAPTPAYAHVPLVVDADGEKLSKRHEGLTLAALRAAGVTPERLVGYLAYSLGLLEHPEGITARELVGEFRWERLRRDPWRLPRDLVGALQAVR